MIQYLFIILLPCVQSLPVINSVVGNFERGSQLLRVDGSGFGTKYGQVEPFMTDYLDADAYASLQSGDIAPVQLDGATYAAAPWPRRMNYGTEPLFYKPADSSNLRYANHPCYRIKRKGGFSGLTVSGLTATAEWRPLYFSWWLMSTHDSIKDQGNGGVSSKMLRIWADGSGTNGRSSWMQERTAHSVSDGAGGITGGPSHYYDVGWLKKQEWTFMEAIVYNHNASGNIDTFGHGSIELRVNNQPLIQCCDHTLASNNGAFDYIMVFGIDPSFPDRYADDFYFHIGDIYIDNSVARVVVGNAPSYGACTHLELQRPRVQWIDSSIQFDVQYGSFDSSDNLYLYVLNEQGQVNVQGYPVQVGAPTVQPPPPPPTTSPPPPPPPSPTTSPPPPSPTLPPAPTPPCIAHYTFDSNGIDAEQQHDATLMGDAVIQSGEKMLGSGALRLQGNGFVDAGSGWGGGVNRFSISLWVKVNSWLSSDARIISKAHGTGDGDHEFMLSGLNGKVRSRLSIENEGTSVIVGTTMLVINEWHHIGLTYDGATVVLYVNGTIDGSDQDFGGGVVLENSNDPVIIGAQPPLFDKQFDGFIDDLRICNHVLDMNEIYQQAFVMPTPSPPPAPPPNIAPPTASGEEKTTTIASLNQNNAKDDIEISSGVLMTIIVVVVACCVLALVGGACLLLRHRSTRRRSNAYGNNNRRKRHSSVSRYSSSSLAVGGGGGVSRQSSGVYPMRRSRANTNQLRSLY